MTKITATVKLEGAQPGGPTKFYGKLVITGIQYEGGGTVTVNNFLVIVFRSPAVVKITPPPSDFWYQTHPDVSITPEIYNSQVSSSPIEYITTAKLTFATKHTIGPNDIFNFGINGDLLSKPEQYWKDSFQYFVDHVPTTNTE